MQFYACLTITPTELRSLSRLPKQAAKNLLATKLGYKVSDLVYELREAAFLDYTFDAFKFVTLAGMAWTQATESLVFITDYLVSICTLTLIEAAELLHCSLVNASTERRINAQNCERISRYVSRLIFPIFKLYQHVFTEDREHNIAAVSMLIETPLPPAPLRMAQPAHTEEYNFRMELIKADERKRKALSEDLEGFLKLKTNLYIDRKEQRMWENTEPPDSSLTYEKALEIGVNCMTEECELVKDRMNIDIVRAVNAAEVALAIKYVPLPVEPVEKDSKPEVVKKPARKKKKK